MSKQSLLLVDGDTRSLRVLEVSLRKSGFTVTPAASVEEAIEALKRDLPALIISETAVSSAEDGFAFRDQIRGNSQYADIPFVFLTAETTLENKIRGLELGADDYLTKPIYIKEVIARINILLHKRQRAEFAKHGEGVRFSGRLADLPVVDVIQTIEVSRKSGVIQFVSDQRRASIYFRDGKVIDAEAGTLQGEDAVYRLLTWTEGEFEVVFRTVRRREVIAASSQALLMEGMRRLDEWSRLLEELPPLSYRFVLDTATLAERLGDIPDENNPILRLFDGKRTLLEVIEASSVGDLECLQAISRLHFEGLLLDPFRDGEASPPLPRFAESSGPVLGDIASTYAAVDAFRPEASRPAAGEPSGNGGAMKLIEEAVSAVQADAPSIEFIPPSEDSRAASSAKKSPDPESALDAAAQTDVLPLPLPAAPLARVRLLTREVDPRIINARATVERLRDRKSHTAGDEESQEIAPPIVSNPPGAEVVPVAVQLESPVDAGVQEAMVSASAQEPVVSAGVQEAMVSASAQEPVVSASVQEGAVGPSGVTQEIAAGSSSQPNEAPVVAAAIAPAELPEADIVVVGGDVTGLKIIGSHGRERATAAGELTPAAPSGLTPPPERELITIMPRRTTRGAITAEVAAVASPPAPSSEPKPLASGPSKVSPSPAAVGGGVRRSANARPLVLALIVLAACLAGVAITIQWRNRARERAAFDANGPATNAPLSAATGSVDNDRLAGVRGPSDHGLQTEIDAAAGGLSVDAGAPADAAVHLTGVQVREDTDAGTVSVEVGHANIAVAADAGVTNERLDAGVDSIAEARRLYEQARAALEEGDAHKALTLASASLKLRKTARTYLEYARALQRLGHVDEALEAVDSALAIVPTYAPSWSQRGMILWASRRREEARMAFHRYLDLDPNGRDAVTVRQLLNQP